MKANAVNLATFANALCHLNATPLSTAVLAPCAWGENSACGGAWQGVVNLATHNTAQRGEFGNETAKRGKIQWHGNKIQRNKFIKANTANGTHSTTNSTKYGEFGNANSEKRYFASETMHDTASIANSVWQAFTGKTAHGKFGLASVAKMGGACGRSGQGKNGSSVWAGDFSLSLSRCSHFLARLWAKFKGLFYPFCRSFISLYFRFCSFHRNFISSYHKFFLFHRSFISYFL